MALCSDIRSDPVVLEQVLLLHGGVIGGHGDSDVAFSARGTKGVVHADGAVGSAHFNKAAQSCFVKRPTAQPTKGDEYHYGDAKPRMVGKRIVPLLLISGCV